MDRDTHTVFILQAISGKSYNSRYWDNLHLKTKKTQLNKKRREFAVSIFLCYFLMGSNNRSNSAKNQKQCVNSPCFELLSIEAVSTPFNTYKQVENSCSNTYVDKLSCFVFFRLVLSNTVRGIQNRYSCCVTVFHQLFNFLFIYGY